MKFDNILNPEAKTFLEEFTVNRAINREFYEKVPDDQFNFRMVDTPERKSDSVRETLAHQIAVQIDYLNAIESGKLMFVAGNNTELKKLSKEKLLDVLTRIDTELTDLLADQVNCVRKISVPWSEELIPATEMLWGLNNHEILTTGWILAIMDHLNMERFPKLKERWG